MAKNLKIEPETVEEIAISVSAYILFLNTGLKDFRAKIYGETSGVKKSKKGHLYFSLKDKKDESILECMIWKEEYTLFGVELKDGIEIEVSGFPSIYPRTGRLRFMVQAVSLRGEGELRKAYEKLKARLAKEGLFAEERKRPIPAYPHRVGVITSLTGGVVIHDFLSNLRKFGFKIKALDTQVEGLEAIRDILSSLDAFEKEDIEVLIIMRGGGSLQSLAAFDNEVVARKVSNSPVPVIAAIGHHVDIPLVALVADKAVSTPTAAASELSYSWREAKFQVEKHEKSIMEGYKNRVSRTRLAITQYILDITEGLDVILSYYKEVEKNLLLSLSILARSIFSSQNFLTENGGLITKGFAGNIQTLRDKCENFSKLIELNNPLRQLGLGYSIVSRRGRIVKRVEDLDLGAIVDMLFADGQAQSEIKNLQYKKEVER